MDEITELALSTMTTVLSSYLPAAIPNVDQTMVLIPSKVKPTGLGGFVGVHEDPQASLYGRLIEANTEITLISSDGVGVLQEAVASYTQALLSQDRATLRSSGIFKLDLDHLSDIAHTGSGNNERDMRTAILKIIFEFIPTPLDPESSIDEVIHNVELGLAQGKGSFFDVDFAAIDAAGDDPLDSFEFVDDPDVVGSSPAGNWVFDSGAGTIEQNRNVRGGGASLSMAKKAGAQALLLKDGDPYLSRNFIARAEMESGEVDGMGFIFRWLDADNFYILLISARHDYHVLIKKFEGSYEFLDSGGSSEEVGYNSDEKFESKLIVEDNKFTVYLNNNIVMSGSDDSITAAGRLGFITHRNIAARFYNIKIIDFK